MDIYMRICSSIGENSKERNIYNYKERTIQLKGKYP